MQQKWTNRLKRSQTGTNVLRVGLVWAGNPATKRDHFRSPGLAGVESLFAVSGIDFVVLQVGEGRQDLDARPLPRGVIDLGCEVTDLADTAAIMSGLDLDDQFVHSALAPGRRVWGCQPGQ